ncbi:A24 family peptidase [Gordonia aurantiaca]|uniref:A24 family peptidase n=1 Tax=Gordonia sp. B21 TaxID=3151852 RepID=UPI0032654AB9
MTELAILLWLAGIAVTDLRTRRIPNPMVWPGVVAVASTGVAEPGVVLAGLVAAAPYLVAFYTRGCGGGDVKLAFVCGGLALCWDAALTMVALAALIALATAVVTRRSGRGDPHAPALVVALCWVSDLLF